MKNGEEGLVEFLSKVVLTIVVVVVLMMLGDSCAKAEPIPGQVQLKLVNLCIAETNQPAMCECLIDSMATKFVEVGLSFPDKMPNEAQAQYLYQIAISECQGLAPIQQAEQL